MNSNIIYTDVKNNKLRKKRKNSLYLTYLLVLVFSGGLLFFIWALYSFGESLLYISFLTICSILAVGFFSWVYIFKEGGGRGAYQNGIILTRSNLNLYGEQITLSAINKCDILKFQSSIVTYLGIKFTINGKRRIKLIRESDTTDVYSLCNKIHEIKGWPKQTKIMKTTWSNWK